MGAALKRLSFDFQIKKEGKGSVVIAGLANANTIDRMKERILPTAWDLENYKKNPVVLFDHGHDPTFGFMPIGRATLVEAREEGLYTEAEISRSKSDKITAVRDLIEEGILKSFSVGFDPKDTQKSADNPEIMEITKAELIENSVVPIPMNQDSTFSRLRKRKSFWNSPLAKRWYDAFLDRVAACKKSAWVAAAVHQRFYDLMESGEIRNRDAAMRYISEESGATPAQVKAALAGDTLPVPGPMLDAFATVLHIDRQMLVELNKGDFALLERVMSRDEKGAQGGGAVDPNKKPEDTTPPPATEDPNKKPPAKDGQGVVAYISVPKAQAETSEAAAQSVADAGYSVDAPEEMPDAWCFWQVPKDSVNVDGGMTVDIGNGVMALVAPKADGGAADPNAGKAGDAPQAGDPPSAEDTTPADDAALTKAKELVAAAAAILNDGGDTATAIAKLKEAATALGAGKGLDIFDVKAVTVGDDNPYLKSMEAQTGILGAMLNELKGMSGKLDGLADVSVQLAKVAGGAKDATAPADGGGAPAAGGGKDDDLSKSLDLLQDYQKDLDKKLKRLNV